MFNNLRFSFLHVVVPHSLYNFFHQLTVCQFFSPTNSMPARVWGSSWNDEQCRHGDLPGRKYSLVRKTKKIISLFLWASCLLKRLKCWIYFFKYFKSHLNMFVIQCHVHTVKSALNQSQRDTGSFISKGAIIL